MTTLLLWRWSRIGCLCWGVGVENYLNRPQPTGPNSACANADMGILPEIWPIDQLAYN
jgi:hypothetical protein